MVATRSCAGALVALCALVTTGCPSKIEYNTHADAARLRALQGQPILLLRFEYSPDALVGPTALTQALADQVAVEHKANFLNRHAAHFVLTDGCQRVAETYGPVANLEDPGTVAKMLGELHAEGGVAVSVSYGYEMPRGSLEDKFVEKTLNKALPEGVVGVLVGREQIRSYDFAVRTRLFDREGRVVWDFYGKGSALPTFATMFSADEAARAFAGLAPDEAHLAATLSSIMAKYEQYVSWLMEQDLNGRDGHNYFVDYRSDQKDEHLTVLTAENTSFVPNIKGYGLYQ